MYFAGIRASFKWLRAFKASLSNSGPFLPATKSQKSPSAGSPAGLCSRRSVKVRLLQRQHWLGSAFSWNSPAVTSPSDAIHRTLPCSPLHSGVYQQLCSYSAVPDMMYFWALLPSLPRAAFAALVRVVDSTFCVFTQSSLLH